MTRSKKIWSIPKITDAWGINERTAKRLAGLGIHSMAELAHADPFILKEKMGVIGAQLYASAWRIDRTDLAEEVLPKDKSLGTCRSYRTIIREPRRLKSSFEKSVHR